MDIALAYLHYLSIIVIAACLAAEFTLLGAVGERAVIERLPRVDLAYFVALGLAAVSGFGRFSTSARGLMHYADNMLFWFKLLLFTAVAALSILPTRRYLRWRHQAHMDVGFRIPADAVKSTRAFVGAELIILALLPLTAVLMARGAGGWF